jgi:hypothetical protein
MMMSLVVVMMVVVSTATLAVVVVVVLMLVMVMVVMVLMLVIMVVVVLMLVIMVVMVLMLVIMVVMVLMLVMVVVALPVMVVMMVLVFMLSVRLLSLLRQHFKLEISNIFHCRQNLLSINQIPCGRNDMRVLVVLTYQLNCLVELVITDILRSAQNNGSCVLNLVVEKFTEILHINLDFRSVSHSRCTVEPYFIFNMQILDSLNNVRKLANS